MIDYINYKIMKKNIFKNMFNYKKNNIKFNEMDLYILLLI